MNSNLLSKKLDRPATGSLKKAGKGEFEERNYGKTNGLIAVVYVVDSIRSCTNC